MHTASIPFRVLESQAYRPSLGFPRSGLFIYRLDASSHAVMPYVPALSAGMVVMFVAVDVTNDIYVTAKQAAPINGSRELSIQLVNVGDTLILSADTTAAVPTWRVHNNTIEVS